MRVLKWVFALALLFLYGCGAGGTLTIDEMLQFAGVDKIPPAENYEDYGAVILYENTHTQFSLDGGWNFVRTQRFHRAFVYYNDKAEDYLTQSIYLDADRKLTTFMARTIRPDGTIQELTTNDLIRTQMKEEIAEFSDDASVKFTFSGVTPGSILEYSYEVSIYDSFILNDYWPVQGSIPKLYTRYAVQIPTIFFVNKINWNYSAMNLDLPRPQEEGDLVNASSMKNRNTTYYWELKNIEAFEYEPKMPPYDDAAQYVILGIQRENWNKISESYWERISKYFNPSTDESIKKLAEEIVGDETDEIEKIRKVYNYTQQNYRYVAIDIGESGYIPHMPAEIISKKYGDCKDMTVLNVVLLKSLGIDAYPVLIKTKGEGQVYPHIKAMQFNHMIAMVKSTDGKIFWLDATGSSCPIEEVYSSLEGTKGLVINTDGTSWFSDLPTSKSRDNQLKRFTTLEVMPDGSVTGHTKMVLNGNQNLSFRSSLKDATESDMKKVIESYVNANTADIEVSNITYDDPSEIKNEITVEFDIKHDNLALKSNNLLMLTPYIYPVDSDLDRFRDEERKFPIIFYAPYEYYDEVKITFPEDELEFASMDDRIVEKFYFGKVTSYCRQNQNEVNFERRITLDETVISAKDYQEFRTYLKTINKANRFNLALNKK